MTPRGLMDGEEAGDFESDLTRSFGVALDPAAPVRTMGELFNRLTAGLPLGPRQGNLDTGVRAYRMLLPFLRRHAGRERIHPSTALAAIFTPREYGAAMKELGTITGLKLPTPPMGRVSGMLVLATFGTLPLGFVVLLTSISWPNLRHQAGYIWLGFPVLMAAGLAINRLFGPDLSGPRLTVAWLARGIAALNYRRLAQAPYEGRDIWNALVRLTEDYADPEQTISPDSVIVDGA
jgi:hypothetical protein